MRLSFGFAPCRSAARRALRQQLAGVVLPIFLLLPPLVLPSHLLAAQGQGAPPSRPSTTRPPPSAEKQLHEVLSLIVASDWPKAMGRAQALADNHPNFLLGQLVYGDLLLAKSRPLTEFGAAAPTAASSPTQLDDLRAEARQRLEAIRQPPPPHKIPRQFLKIPPAASRALAVDTSKSRLYVFENTGGQLRLISDHYVSLGKLGTEKQIEGDQRTPLGVYFITSRLGRNQIDTNNFGMGALPLNYPNEYDRRLGKTGSGIWLHGVPSTMYSRPPNATDGCVALPNDELVSLLATLEPKITPIVITQRIEWVEPQALAKERAEVMSLLDQWRDARSRRSADAMLMLYSQQFQSGEQDLDQWIETINKEMALSGEHPVTLKDISILTWKYRSEVMVITFSEIRTDRTDSQTIRQYWGKENGQWKIFFEGIAG